MHLDTFEMIALAAGLIVFITWRQTQWQSVEPARLLRMPVVFAVLGVVNLVGSLHQLHGYHPGALDSTVLVAELGLGLLSGWLMARFTRIARVDGVLKSRLAAPGVAVWISFLLVRIGLGVIAHQFGAEFAAQTGTILLVIAVVKGAQAVLVRQRVDRHLASEVETPVFAGVRR